LKKIILFSLLFTSLLATEAKVYTGFSAGYMQEEFTDNKTTNEAEMAKFKVGYGIRKAYAIEFSLEYLKNKSTIFSTTGKDGDKFGLNVELVKAFDWNIFILPYFKAGFGAGYFDIQHDTKSSLNYGSYNLGLGFFIPINEHFDVELGYDYKSISYEKIVSTGKEVSSNLNGGYMGLNIRF